MKKGADVHRGRAGMSEEGREVRLTVPLFFGDFEASGRIELTETVVLAELDEQERQRIHSYWSNVGIRPITDPPRWRLEIHGVVVPDDVYAAVEPAGEVVRWHLAVLSCAVAEAPFWPSVLIDEPQARRWVRWSWAWRSGGDPNWRTRISETHLMTWSQLLRNWPPEARHRNIDAALDHYYDSILDGRIHPRKALMSASVAHEVLLGHGIRSEQRYRLSQRGAVLTARGHEGPRIQRALRGLYDARSKLVHAGEDPDSTLVVQLQRFLMAAIPRMARLASTAGSYEDAIRVLEQAPYLRPSHLEELLDDRKSWWAHSDAVEALLSDNQP